MTKKQEKERNKIKRVWAPFNTGTRTHKSAKDYNRKEGKKICKEYLSQEEYYSAAAGQRQELNEP